MSAIALFADCQFRTSMRSHASGDEYLATHRRNERPVDEVAAGFLSSSCVATAAMGGVKASGIGRELGTDAIGADQQFKSIYA
jgi:acyl-CoA reductase-like NAD-dependent aldehyde dehydrogenase